MHNKKCLVIDVGGTSIKYTITDRNAEITKINEIKTRIRSRKLFKSLHEIISLPLNWDAKLLKALKMPNSNSSRIQAIWSFWNSLRNSKESLQTS